MFSIIIPVYNVEKYLSKCIDSIRRQSYRDFEIILIDDGSTDCSAQLCDEYKIKDERIKVIHKTNGGASHARNVGINEASNKYTMFMDSDDYLMTEDLLEQLSGRIQLMNADIVCFNFCKVYPDREKKQYFTAENMPLYSNIIEQVAYMENNNLWISSAWNKVIRTDLLKDNRLFFKEGVFSEDIEWNARVADAARSFDYLNIIGIAYVQRQNSVSHTMTEKKVFDLKNNVLSTEKVFMQTNAAKKSLLENYLSYQVGILLYNVACFDKNIQRQMKSDMVHLRKYLNISKSRGVRAIKTVWSILGYNGMMRALQFMKKVNS